jgi:hypothetical protein
VRESKGEAPSFTMNWMAWINLEKCDQGPEIIDVCSKLRESCG